MTISLFLAALLAAPQPGVVRTFGDWAVGCDNGLACEVTSLVSDSASDDLVRAGWLTLTRGPERQAAPQIAIDFATPIGGRHSIQIDGKPIITTSFARLTEGWSIKGAQATTLAQAMAGGRTLEVVDARRKPVARFSLTGSAAGLRYVDDRQRRAGTVTALVARGKAPGSAVPPPPPLPEIAAAPLPAGTAELPRQQTIVEMLNAAQCEPPEDGEPAASAHRLSAAQTLILVACGAGAYNYDSVAYVMDSSERANDRNMGGLPIHSFAPAVFDFEPGWGGTGDAAMLVNASWDEKAATLTSYAKGRGLGDCGSASDFVWDGTRFRLVGARRMDECRGSINWITVWRARPVRR